MLTIINERGTPPSKNISQRERRKLALEAKYERAWLVDPEQFLPSILDQNRIARSWNLIEHLLKTPLKIADLACGDGIFTIPLLKMGHRVDAVDIASNALKKLPSHPHLRTFQQALPKTTLNDFAYDLVLALDLLTELHPDDYRLFMSEIQRLMGKNSLALISTPLDTQTIEPLRVFLNLLDFEFNVQAMTLSHHAFFQRFAFVEREWLIKPLENLTRFFQPEIGITHAIALVEKKSLWS